MERIRNLNGYQKGILILMLAMSLVFAVIYLALTLSKKERGVGFLCRMLLGGLCVLSGGFMCFAKQGAFSYLIFAAGILLLVDGSFKLQTAILSKRYRSWFWWVMLSLAVAVKETA